MKSIKERTLRYMSLKKGYVNKVISKERREEINKIINNHDSRH